MTKGKSTDNADASFVQGGSGLPSLDENLAYFPGATAATTYAKITKSLQSCGQISISSDGTTLKGSIGAMSFPKVGDESNAYSVDLTADGLNVTVDLVTLMKGNELCTVDYLDLGDVDVSDFETYVNLAVGKLT